MSRLCVDTSAYSHLRRGDSRVAELLDGAEWVGVPAIVVGELEAGFAAGDRRSRNQRELAQFLAEVETLAVDESVARVYGEIVAALRDAGVPLPTNDIWIAATAARHGATVLTYDAHFSSIARVGSIVLQRT